MLRLILCILLAQAVSGLEISRLRVEYLEEPLGLHEREPRFSWVLDSDRRGARQSAYRLTVRSGSGSELLWNSGRVESRETNQIVYAGRPLRSGESGRWQVEVWDEAGDAFRSTVSGWSVGLLDDEDWEADWIGLPRPEPVSGRFPAGVPVILMDESRREGSPGKTFEKTFVVERLEASAELMVVGSRPYTFHFNERHIVSGTAHEGQRLPVEGYLKRGENRVKVTPKASPGGASGAFEFRGALRQGSQWVKSDGTWGGVVLGDTELGDGWTDESRRLAARYLRREFTLAKPVEQAVLHVATGGLHEVRINGEPITDEVLAPGMTDFQKRMPSSTYEVTERLKLGANAMGMVLGNGRFHAPRLHVPTRTLDFGAPMVRVRLVVRHPDGSRSVVVSDETWRATDQGPIRANNEYDGEAYDARLEMPGWAEVGFDDGGWAKAERLPAPAVPCRSLQREPIRVLDERRAREIVEIRPGVWRFDFGENLTGRTRMKVRGERGTTIRQRHSQRLADDGSLDMGNLRSALATNHYTLRGDPDGESWEPLFVSHGFRWVELSGLKERPGPETLVARIIGNDLSECGTFESSDPILNRTMRLCRNTLRSNYLSVPLDCADRDERQGWQGDRAAACWSEASLFDIAALYTRWLEEIRDSQKDHGIVSDVAPALWPFHSGSPVWPSVQTMAPRLLFMKYGDRRIMERHFEGSAAWVRYQLGRRGDDGLLGPDVYGDWCPPPVDRSLVNAVDPDRNTDKAFVANAYLVLHLKLMAEAAELLGKEPADWEMALEALTKAMVDRWWQGERFSTGTQTSFALAHSIGLVPEGKEAVFAKAMKERLRADGHRVGTGNIGIQWLHTTIDELCGSEAALRLATQGEYPGYGYMLSQGATTMWELWNGDTSASTMSSLNHIMMVGDFPRWCFEHLAGIQARMDGPGYARITLRPSFPKGLTSVSASHETIRGRVESHWRVEEGAIRWDLRIPTNSEAELHFPSGEGQQVYESGERVDLSDALDAGDRRLKWFPSGRYRFEIRTRH